MREGNERVLRRRSSESDDPDHALATREGAAKRWYRGARRRAIEPRNQRSGVPTRSQTSEGNTGGGVIASRHWAPRGRRTQHARDLSMLRTGRSHGHPPVVMEWAGRAGKVKAVIP